jgi:hypothetical protein
MVTINIHLAKGGPQTITADTCDQAFAAALAEGATSATDNHGNTFIYRNGTWQNFLNSTFREWLARTAYQEMEGATDGPWAPRTEPDLTKIYVGWRPPQGAGNDGSIAVTFPDGHAYPLPIICFWLCLFHKKPRAHIPNWGDVGLGDLDTSLSILADFFGETPNAIQLDEGKCFCFYYHRQFKEEIIFKLDVNGFQLPATEIAAWLSTQPPVDPSKEYGYGETIETEVALPNPSNVN